MRFASGLVSLDLLLVLHIPQAHAVPPFARTYGLSCTTCHVGGPEKLTPFGEAFRDNGYRIPGDAEDFVRTPPLILGRPQLDGQPGAFRTQIPSGEIPATAPLSAVGKASLDQRRGLPARHRGFRHGIGSVMHLAAQQPAW